jgi:glycosyltransferase involved in cell wall biosynthesis
MSAMKAQAYGAIPVVTDYAALHETVKWGEKVPVDITEKDGQERYKKVLIDLMKNEKKQEEIRKEMMESAPIKFSWESVSEQWDTLFKSKKDVIKII